MRLYGDLDRLRPALVAWHAHIPVHEPDEVLHGVQNGLNLQLNGWSPRLDESLSLNCRLIQLTGDQLFFWALSDNSTKCPIGAGFRISGLRPRSEVLAAAG